MTNFVHIKCTLFKKKQTLSKEDTNLGDKLQSAFTFRRNVNLRSCGNCKLIDSGDVAFYGVTCPQCGQIPPSKVG